MMNNNNNNWEFNLDEYIKEGEPNKVEKSKSWKTAIGLQDVDGLKTSSYLLDTAKEHIEGKIDIITAKKRVVSYYEERMSREKSEAETKEADIVSTRIAELLGERTFNFSPVELKNIHERMFLDLLPSAGKYRDYNITKKEWVLNGETVLYVSYKSIEETLNYDFNQEKKFSYENLSTKETIKNIAKFTSDIWQVHPFCEGNTRTTAVFIIKYLKTLGFNVNNDIFAENSWYFRNALVRANYNDLQKNIVSTNKYLEYFFENLLLNAENELKNRYLHIDYKNKVNNNI